MSTMPGLVPNPALRRSTRDAKGGDNTNGQADVVSAVRPQTRGGGKKSCPSMVVNPVQVTNKKAKTVARGKASEAAKDDGTGIDVDGLGDATGDGSPMQPSTLEGRFVSDLESQTGESALRRELELLREENRKKDRLIAVLGEQSTAESKRKIKKGRYRWEARRMTGDECNNQTILQDLHKTKIWPTVKHLPAGWWMQSKMKGTLCSAVMDRLIVPDGQDYDSYWNGTVRHAVTSVHSIKGTAVRRALREAYFGKVEILQCSSVVFVGLL